MGKISDLMVRYAEMQGITTDQISPDVTLAQMQAALRASEAIALPVGLGKAALVQSPIPWLTIKSYVEVGLEAVGLTDYTVEVKEQQGLAVLWDAYWVEISALSSSFGRKQLLFQIKLFKTGFNPPVAIEFKQEYKDIATVCSNFLSTFLIQRAIDVMEAEWAAESAAEDAEAELLQQQLAQGEAIAEERAQLEQEENGWL